MDFFNLERILKFLPGIIIGLTVHEFCHAWVALLSGDPTSKEQGRITLNPLKHIDLLGFIFLIFAGFGWAKPVQFNEEKLKRKTDVIKIALAGPLSNAVVAMVFSVLFALLPSAGSYDSNYNVQILLDMVKYAIFINWGLFIFNLIPLPPLDGSHLLFFPLRRYPEIYYMVYRISSFLFLGLLIATFISKVNLLQPIVNLIWFFTSGFMSLLGYHGFYLG